MFGSTVYPWVLSDGECFCSSASGSDDGLVASVSNSLLSPFFCFLGSTLPFFHRSVLSGMCKTFSSELMTVRLVKSTDCDKRSGHQCRSCSARCQPIRSCSSDPPRCPISHSHLIVVNCTCRCLIARFVPKSRRFGCSVAPFRSPLWCVGSPSLLVVGCS